MEWVIILAETVSWDVHLFHIKTTHRMFICAVQFDGLLGCSSKSNLKYELFILSIFMR